MEEEVAAFRRADRPDAVCLVVDGEIDLSVLPGFQDALVTLVQDARSPAVVDLSRVTFFNSSGLGALITAQQVAGERGVELVVEPSRAVRRVIEITGLDQTFELRDPA